MVVSTPGLQSRESEKLQHILLHAAQIFAEEGYEGASIRDISKATGVSLSGLYYYFESKQKLLYLIQNSVFTLVMNRLEERLQGVEDPTTRLRVMVQNHIEYFLSHPAEMKVLSHEADALEEPYIAEVAAIKRRYYSLAREIFRGVAAQGTTPRLNPRIAVLSLFGMMNWIYKWHNPEVDPGAEGLTDTIMAIFLQGVRGSKEPRLKLSVGAGSEIQG